MLLENKNVTSKLGAGGRGAEGAVPASPNDILGGLK